MVEEWELTGQVEEGNSQLEVELMEELTEDKQTKEGDSELEVELMEEATEDEQAKEEGNFELSTITSLSKS